MSDWRDMPRDLFDHDAPPAPLFELTPESVPADDGHDTTPLF